MTQMRHDIVVSAVSRVICRASCPLQAPLQPQAQPMQQQQHAQQAATAPPVQPCRQLQRSDPGKRRGDIMAVLPGGQIVIVDTVVAHRLTGLYPCWQRSWRCCCQAGWGWKGPGLLQVRRTWPV